MKDKITDKKIRDQLAIIAAAKTSHDDDIATVTRKVVADYIEAKKIIQGEASVRKVAKKTAKAAQEKKNGKSKKQKKASQKIDQKAAGE